MMRAKFKFFYGLGNLYYNRSLIIYTEHEYNRGINEYIQENYDDLAARFASYGKTFLYIPRLSSIVESISLSYLTGRHNLNIINPANTGKALMSVLPEEVFDKLPYPSLCYFGEFEVNGFRLDIFDAPEQAFNAYFVGVERELGRISINYQFIDDDGTMAAEMSERPEYPEPPRKKRVAKPRIKNGRVEPGVDEQRSSLRFKRNESDEDIRFRDPDIDEVDKVKLEHEINEPDDRLKGKFSKEDWRLIEQAKDNVRQLLSKGISIDLIYALIQPQLRPSRLLITKDYRIFLPDYDNLEIILGPIDKTVFFFFLRHPEGVNFKNLMDHKDELSNIYKKITNRKFSILSPIQSLVDPTNNSINEKCSHIRRVFLANLAVPLANNYYIVGGRGEDKRIELDRSLVEWECEF